MQFATCKSSVPDRRPVVNTHKVANIAPAQRRAAARMGVVVDTRVSPGARLLYILLDDHAGARGSEWTHPETLASTMGISVRQVYAQLAELEAAGHITRQRGQYRSMYRLSWAAELQNSAVVESAELKPELKISAKIAPVSITEPAFEPVCVTCEDTGRIGGWHSHGGLCECRAGQEVRERLMRAKWR